MLQIPKIFRVAELPDTDLVHMIIKPVPTEPTEPKVILEGSQSGIRLCFATNRKIPRVYAIVNPRTHRVIESGVQYYSNSLSDGSGFKKKIHGGDGGDEKQPSGGYDQGCAAFLEFHEVSKVRTTGTNTRLTSRVIQSAVPFVPVP